MSVVAGTTATLTARFLTVTGNPLVLDGPPTFELEDAAGDPVVVTGLVVVDMGEGEWRATFTVDEDLGWYRAVWNATVDGAPLSGSEMFEVVEAPGVVVPGECGPDTVYGPCQNYATITDVRGLCDTTGLDIVAADPDADPPVEEGADVALVEQMLLYATRRTFLATGGRFAGCCEATIRPPGWCCGLCGCTTWGRCGCQEWPLLPLPYLPVRSIASVIIDGVVLDPVAYRLVDGAWLARIDGDPWPACNDMTKPLTEEGTWAHTDLHGLNLPGEGVPLVAQYAAELAKSCRGFACGLGPGIRVVHRDGVDFEIIDPTTDKTLTGFGPLDEWITALHGGHVTEPPRLYRPGREYARPLLVAAP